MGAGVGTLRASLLSIKDYSDIPVIDLNYLELELHQDRITVILSKLIT